MCANAKALSVSMVKSMSSLSTLSLASALTWTINVLMVSVVK